jgi:GNAT superfamily N-acetyltransferase
LSVDGVSVRVVDVSALSSDDDARLVELVARTFPGEPSLKGRWYHDTPPSLVLLAEHERELIAVRTVTFREVVVAERALRLAGFGIGVSPAWQRRGVGILLTHQAIDVVSERGVDLALAFLFSPNAEPLLRAHGFTLLHAHVSYTDRKSGARVNEAAPAWARDINASGAKAHVERAGSLDLGTGTW